MTRLQPHWLVDVAHRGDCTFIVTLSCRQGDLGQPWQEIGGTAIATTDLFTTDRSVDVEHTISTWELAPDLKLKLRLTQSSYDLQAETTSLNRWNFCLPVWRRAVRNGC